MSQLPTLSVGVLMRRERVPGPMARWQPWRWVLADVVPGAAPAASPVVPPDVANPAATPAAPAPQCVERSDDHSLWLHTGHQVTLHRDDVEGYHLNLSTEQPCFWVMWRADPVIAEDGTEDTVAVPQIVTLSYHDAGRWLDAQEHVDRVDAPPEVVVWLRAFTDALYQPEPKRRKRPDSFRALTDRFGNPASVSTSKAGHGPQAPRPARTPSDAADSSTAPGSSGTPTAPGSSTVQPGQPRHGH